VVFVGVSNNDTVADGKGYVTEFDVPYAMAHAPEVWDLYDVPYQPVTIVLDAGGKEVERFDGPVETEPLRTVIEKTL